MRIKSLDDIAGLGPNAKKQIEAVLNKQGGFRNQKRSGSESELKTTVPHKPNPGAGKAKKPKPARVMRTHDDLSYCPWPSTDPFVPVIQRLQEKYGRYDEGGLLLTELIIDGGDKAWRFDIALISPFEKVTIAGRQMHLGYTCLVESDGFGFHRSKDAFKNDRAKQTHALKQGFPLKRITNEDARERLEQVIADIDYILSQPKLYESTYSIRARGKTQSLLQWTLNRKAENQPC